MEFVKLTEKEFKQFAYTHEQATFHQTIGWGKLKQTNGWKYEFIGIKKGKKILAGAMLLSKKTPIKKKMFYAPHGFILDYNDFSLLDEMVKNTKEYVKKNDGIFFKIDPYILLKQRDINGQVVEGGIDNTNIYDHLIRLGFKEINGKVTEQTLQGKWIYWIEIDGKSFDEIVTPKMKLTYRQNTKNGVYIREGSYDELDKFKKIMDHLSNRREFISRSLKYYQDMYKYLSEDNIAKLYFAELNVKEQLEQCKKEKEKLETEYNAKEEDFKNGKISVNEQKFRVRQNELKNAINKNNKNLEEFEKLYKEYGDIVTLGGVMYMIHGNDVLAFIGGGYSDYLNLQPAYSIHYEMMKYAADNGYKYYNFYCISGNLIESDPMYGVYQFKKGFGGVVVELMGEFDMPVRPFYYFLYKTSYNIVHSLKKIKTKLHI